MSHSAGSPETAPRGTLVLFGGGADEALVALLASLMPDRTAPVEILTTATLENPVRTAIAYGRAFRKRGCTQVAHLQVDENHPPDAKPTLARLRRAAVLFISGGDQERLTDFFLGTEFLDIIKEKYQHEASFLLGGTSAGASAMAEYMLVAGRGWRSLLPDGIEVIPGFGLLPGIVLDQHFAERHRYPRLMHAVLAQPACLGLGLSEETGLLVLPGRPAEVFGEEVLFVLDAATATHARLEGPGFRRPISGHGLTLHLLVAGQQLDVATRKVNEGRRVGG